MDAPKCKLCGERHYGLCAARVTKAAPAAVAASEPEKPKPERFDRTAYQREYMRKRRAAAKAAKAAAPQAS